MPSIIRSSRGYGKNKSSSITDVYAKSTTLLLKPDQSTQSFVTDASSNSLEITPVGDARPTNFHPFNEGFYSTQFQGGEYVSYNATTAIGTGDFTLEAWIYPTSFNTGIFVTLGSENTGRIQFLLDSTGQLSYDLYGTGTTVFRGSSVVLNTWSHVAITRTGTKLYAFINGVQAGQTVTQSASFGNNQYQIGVNGAKNSAYFAGYISNLRIVRGTCLYSANFIPPTSPLTPITGTVLLTCQSPTHIDRSINSATATTAGSPIIKHISPFNQTEPLNYTPLSYGNKMDGTYYHTTPANSAYNIGASDFTFEFWFNLTTQQTYGTIFNLGTYTNGIMVRLESAVMNVYIVSPGGTVTLGAGTAIENTWCHCALVRYNGTAYLYLDGILATSAAQTSDIMPYAGLRIGTSAHTTGESFLGYLSNMRLVVGRAIYTAAFTPPTSPLTAVTGTVFLGYQSSTQVDNSILNATMTTTGSGSNIISPLSPFYAVSTNKLDTTIGSTYFDGAGDYLTASSNNITIGTGDFTVEGWFYLAGPDGTRYDFFANYSGFLLYRYSDNNLYFYTDASGTNKITVSGFTSANYGNRWNHIAITRQSGNTKLFINGTQAGSTFTSDTTNYTGTTMYIGRNGGSAIYYLGNISNFRIVTGTALYTGLFAPPTSPLKTITNTSLLTVQTNAPVNNKTFMDDSLTVGNIVASGNVTKSLVNPFGVTRSHYFNGSSYLTGTGATPFGTNDFTIEFWHYPLDSGTKRSLFQYGVFILAYQGGMSSWIGSSGPNGPSNLTLNAWNHIAAVRSGGTLKIYVNGAPGAGQAFGNDTTNTLIIGYENGSSSAAYGYLSDIRVVNGTALYTTAFTPPKTPPAVVANTNLLTLQNSVPADIASNITYTTTGVVYPAKNSPFTSTVFTPKTYSVFLEKQNQYINILNQDWVRFYGQFTFEGWFNWTVPIAAGNILGVQANNGLALYYDGTGLMPNQYAVGNLVSTTFKPQVGVWYHIAVTRDGNNLMTMWVNGVSVGSATVSTTFAAGTFTIGPLATSGDQLRGYVSNFRVVIDRAVYTAAFTPQITPLEAIPGTVLLTCQSPTFVDNSPTNTPLQVTGTPDTKITDFNPFGYTTSPASIGYSSNVFGGSAYFDGSGDYITVPDSAALRLSNAFTIQGWFNPTSQVAGNVALVSKGAVATGWQVMMGRANTLLVTNATATLSTVTPIRFNEWNHFAVVRQPENRTLVFVNGNLEVTGTVTNPFNEVSDMYIGSGRVAGANVFTGYISDLRIDRTALYANNFALPSAPITAVKDAAFIQDNRVAIFDYTMTNSIEKSNIAISSQHPFNPDGYYSYYFNGLSGLKTGVNSLPALLGSPTGYLIESTFTIEAWIYNTVRTGSQDGSLIGDMNPTGATNNWSFGPGSGGLLTFYWYTGGTNYCTGSTVIPLNTWTHIAVTVDRTAIKMFVNGVQEAVTGTTTLTATSSTLGYLALGMWNNGSGGSSMYAGYVNNLRLVKGVALYTGNFTVPTSPLAITQSSSANTAALINTIPASGGSVYFAGSGPYFNVASTPGQLAFGIGDFTVEMWVYKTIAQGTYHSIYDTCAAGDGVGTGRFQIDNNTNGTLRFMTDAGTTTLLTSATNVLSSNTWHHIAVCRSGTTGYLFLNGNLLTSGSVTTNFLNAANRPMIGGNGYNGGNNWQGYISNIRAVKGQAIYTGKFTPPTAPLGLSQSESANVISLTNVVPTNGNSVYFPAATSSWLTLPSNSTLYRFNTNVDFTLEAWVYPTVLEVGDWGIMDARASAASAAAWVFILSNSGGSYKLNFFNASSNMGSKTVPLNTWTHVAISRVGTNLRLFVNGVLDTTVSAYGADINPGTASARIGHKDYSAGNYDSAGYISNLRVVNGTGLYTTSFTPQRTPLTAVPNTVLLACQSSTFVDNSTYNQTLTTNGSVAIDLTHSPALADVALLTAQGTVIQDVSPYANTFTLVANITGMNSVSPFGISNISLLTAATKNWQDISGDNNVLTLINSPAVNNLNPFATFPKYNSIFFNGASGGQGKITIPPTYPTFNFGTSDFTVDFWMYPMSSVVNEYEILETQVNNAFGIYNRNLGADFSFRGYANTDTRILSSNELRGYANSWVHIAIARSNSYTKAFVNGSLTANVLDLTNYVASNSIPATMGDRMAGGDAFTGMITDFRVTKGVNRYATNYVANTAGIFKTPTTLPYKGSVTNVASLPLQYDLLLVAGGGAGGYQTGGGGGAGGMITTNVTITPGVYNTIIVGAGSAAATVATPVAFFGNTSFRGANSTAFGYTAIGGGQGGGAVNLIGGPGGSGGGSGFNAIGTYNPVLVANAYLGQGTDGGTDGPGNLAARGGGGAGGRGGFASNIAGIGRKWLDGNYYAGGGGGYNAYGRQAGGLGGGGYGANTNTAGNAGQVNTGGGGGGGGQAPVNAAYTPGAAGGSGVAIIRYPKKYDTATGIVGSVDMYEIGDYRYYKFKQSANIMFGATVGSGYISASGGTLTTVGSDRIHTFTSPGIFYVACADPRANITILVVGGGGGGGGGFANPPHRPYFGGGGGAGGMFETTITGLTSGSYNIVVGAGGAGGNDPFGYGSNGGASSANININIVALGGGGGGGGIPGTTTPAFPGGSGGGGGGPGLPGPGAGAGGAGGAGTAGQGSPGAVGTTYNGSFPDGYSGGGGGGAGGTFSTTGTGSHGAYSLGGFGANSSISGSIKTYAAGGTGGTGGSNLSLTYSVQGIGGSGGYDASIGGVGGNGVDGTGSGGGGGVGGPFGTGSIVAGGRGGNGIVIVRYTAPSAIPVPSVGGEAVFTSSGTWTAPLDANFINIVLVGAGGGGAQGSTPTGSSIGSGGGGGGLVWVNNVPVIPGQTYTVTVGSGGATGVVANASAGGNTWFNSSNYIIAYGGGGGRILQTNPLLPRGIGGSYLNNSSGFGGGGDGGPSGSTETWGGTFSGSGGGGAGGYTGSGGQGSDIVYPGPTRTPTSTSGAGGGGGGGSTVASLGRGGGSGGGVGIYGQGADGTRATIAGGAAGGGSGGTPGTWNPGGAAGPAGTYGAGGGGGTTNNPSYVGAPGAPGAVRITWNTRKYYPFDITLNPATNKPDIIALTYVAVGGGGGGSGALASNWEGGGGGAGGYLTGGITLAAGSTLNVVVGSGGSAGPAGSATATNGGNTYIFSTGLSGLEINALGGGYGAGGANAGGNGGSGGGTWNGTGGSGVFFSGTVTSFWSAERQGYNGNTYNGGNGAGGGGGAGGAGTVEASGYGGNGGIGKVNVLAGSTAGQLSNGQYYLAGGGGGATGTTAAGAGGLGGGGRGGFGTAGVAANVNTGGGGGGGSSPVSAAGGAGGSGVVVLSQSNTFPVAASTTANVTYVGDKIIYTFTSSGTLTY
jgi:hypothetical protein